MKNNFMYNLDQILQDALLIVGEHLNKAGILFEAKHQIILLA